jgi:hypothetical protein
MTFCPHCVFKHVEWEKQELTWHERSSLNNMATNTTCNNVRKKDFKDVIIHLSQREVGPDMLPIHF